MLLAGTTCRQTCWGAFSKSCDAYCTLPTRSCTNIGALLLLARSRASAGDLNMP